MALTSNLSGCLLAGLLAASASYASQPSPTEMLAFANSKACLGCHQVDARRVGPSFTLIADRHAGQEGAEEYLASAIRQGGRGRWGAVPMPAQPQVSEADAKRLAQWILTFRPAAPK